jgi:hypothetical protein
MDDEWISRICDVCGRDYDDHDEEELEECKARFIDRVLMKDDE